MFPVFLFKPLGILLLVKVNTTERDRVGSLLSHESGVKAVRTSNPSIVLVLDETPTGSYIPVEPGAGFEPAWTFVSGLQNRCNQPLCDPGLKKP